MRVHPRCANCLRPTYILLSTHTKQLLLVTFCNPIAGIGNSKVGREAANAGRTDRREGWNSYEDFAKISVSVPSISWGVLDLVHLSRPIVYLRSYFSCNSQIIRYSEQFATDRKIHYFQGTLIYVYIFVLIFTDFVTKKVLAHIFLGLKPNYS